MGYKVAVVGATGSVGREMLDILAERAFPADTVVALASRRSLGQEVSFGDKTLKVQALDQYDFSDTDICLMSAGGETSKEWSPRIGQQGCVVIDNSSAFRYDSDVPLIVPEVNADAVVGFTKKNIIANPNCSTAQLVVALKPLHEAATIKRVVVATYPMSCARAIPARSRAASSKSGLCRTGSLLRLRVVVASGIAPHFSDFLDPGRVVPDGTGSG